MERFQDRHVLSKILQESILQMCKVSVGLHSNISIDGIICIATQEDEREIIVKIHEQVSRSSEPEPTKNIIPTPKLPPQNFHCPDEPVFGKFPESGKTPIHIQNFRDFLLSSDDNEDIFGDLTAIKAIMPLNRSESIEMQTSHTAGMDSVVNLIDEDTVSYCEKPTATCSESMVMVKPDPGTSCTVTSLCHPPVVSNCSVLQTRPPPAQARTTPDESSDDDLKIEKLKAGRIRKHKRYPSESSNRLSPTDLINNDPPPPACDDTHVDPPRPVMHEGDDDDSDEAQITASSTVSSNRLDIKPILGRKDTPPLPGPSSLSPTQITTSTSYTNITPSEAVTASTMHQPLSTVHSPSTLIRPTGMTVAQQLQILRQQKLFLPESPAAVEDIRCVDDIPMPQNISHKTYTCPSCGVTCSPFKKFHMHMYREHGAFPCPCCDKLFTHRYSRNRHIVTHHAGDKTFTCPFCNKKYVRADTLKLHVHKQHPDNQLKIHYSYAHSKQLYEPDSTAPSDTVNNTSAGSHTNTSTGNTAQASCTSTVSRAGSGERVAESSVISSAQQEPEVVYNRNLPSKFENVDSENSNSGSADVIENNADVMLSQAQVMSEDTAVIHSSAQVQYLKLESINPETVNHEYIMSMHDDMMHDDIMDMIEISDDETEASDKRLDS